MAKCHVVDPHWLGHEQIEGTETCDLCQQATCARHLMNIAKFVATVTDIGRLMMQAGRKPKQGKLCSDCGAGLTFGLIQISVDQQKGVSRRTIEARKTKLLDRFSQ